MSSYSIEAIVIKKTKLGETDTILTLFGEDGSLHQAIAKGARKPGSKIGGRAELFTVINALIHKGRSLDVITEAITVASNGHLREHYEATLAASVVIDFIAKTVAEGMSEERLYLMTRAYLAATEQAVHNGRMDAVEPLMLAYLLKALAMQGYRPALDECALCFTPIEVQNESVEYLAWSSIAGGMMCEECASGYPNPLHISAPARAWLNYLLNSTFETISQATIEPAAVADAYELTETFLYAHVSERLKSLELYRTMKG